MEFDVLGDSPLALSANDAHRLAIERGADCKRCPLYGLKQGPVVGEIRHHSRLIAVGQEPGADEVLTGRPFVGKSGQLYGQALASGNISRDENSTTNALLCRPPEDLELYLRRLSEGVPSPIDCCSPRLKRDLEESGASTILAIGSWALKSIADIYSIPIGKGKERAGEKRLAGIKAQAGHPFELPDGKILCSSLHPAFALRKERHKKHIVFDQIRRAAKIANSGIEWKRPEILLEPTLEQIENAIGELITCNAEIAEDIETDSLFVDTRIRCVGIGATDRKTPIIVIPRFRMNGAPLWSREDLARIDARICELNDRNPLVFHNGLFDTLRLLRTGLMTDRAKTWFDSMFAHRNSMECDSEHDLGFVAGRAIDLPLWKVDVDHKVSDNIEKDRDLWLYNGLDIDGTIYASEFTRERLRLDGTEPQQRLDEKTAIVLREMTDLGLWIDETERARISESTGATCDALRAKIQEVTGVPDMNPRSTHHLRAWFYKTKGYKPLINTESKEWEPGEDPSTSAAALIALEDAGVDKQTSAAIDAILKFKSYDKLKSSFVDNLPTIASDVDGLSKLHPYFGIVVSGRYNSQPNCFDASTEILTDRGWIAFPALKTEDRIAQFWKETGEIDFVCPTHYTARQFSGTMFRIQNQAVDLLVTADHRLLLETRKGERFDATPLTWTYDRKIFHAGSYDGDVSFDLDRLAFVCAAQADGWMNLCNQWDFKFTKARKIRRLKDILARLREPYRERRTKSGQTRITLRNQLPWVDEYLSPKEKTFGDWVLHLTRECREFMRHEVNYWDGCLSRDSMYSSSNRRNADLVQTLYILSGERANVRKYENAGTTKPNWQVDRVRKAHSWTTNTTPTREAYEGGVFCLSVPSSYVVVRRNGKVVITGQCQNWPKGGAINMRKMIVAPPGHVWVGADYEQIEARLGAVESQDHLMLDAFAKGLDVHAMNAASIFTPNDIEGGYRKISADRKGTPEQKRDAEWKRTVAKRVAYLENYGGEGDKLFSMLKAERNKVTNERPFKNLPEKLAEEWHKTWHRLHPTKAWHARVHRELRHRGHVLENLHGRRRFFPGGPSKKNAPPNHTIQAKAGAIATRAILRLAEAIPFRSWSRYTGISIQIHDYIGVIVPEGRAEEAKKLVESCLYYEEPDGRGGIMQYGAKAEISRTLGEQ